MKYRASVGISQLLLATAGIAPACVGAQTAVRDTVRQGTVAPALARYRYRLLGVYDAQSGDPVEGVEVADMASGFKAMTTRTGTVSLLFLPDGGSLVRIRKIGYEGQTLIVPISSRDTTPVTIVMEHVATLPTIVVHADSTRHLSPLMREFEDHKKTGVGQYLDELAFRKFDNSTMSSFLGGQLHGIQMVSMRGGVYLVSSRKQCRGGALATSCKSPNCFPTVYTNGVVTWNAGMGNNAVPDFSRLSPLDYEAAEFYSGAASLPEGVSPTEAECGVIMLYSRER